jgi:hypothetical protein
MNVDHKLSLLGPINFLHEQEKRVMVGSSRLQHVIASMSSLKDSQCASHNYLKFVTSQNISMEANMSRNYHLKAQRPVFSKA